MDLRKDNFSRQMVALSIFFILVGAQFLSPHVSSQVKKASESGPYSEQIPQNYYYSIPVTLGSTSLVAYVTGSNVSVSTSFMSSSQFAYFQYSGDYGASGSIFDQNGTHSEDVVLVTPGTYYLVLVANCCNANVTYVYNTLSDFDVQNATTYVGEFVNLAPYSTLSIPLHLTQTLGSSFNMSLIGASNQTVQYSIYDASTENVVFSSPEITITNVTSPSLSYNFTSFQEGLYFLNITNSLASTAYVYFEYHLAPVFVNPYIAILLHGGANSPQPTGIAAYGIMNDSGVIAPYHIKTNEVVGLANITSLLAYNSTAEKVGIEPYAATLQLNSILVINDASGSKYVYWPQNVMDFNTNTSVLQLADNVLNVTGDNAFLTNQTITSQNGGYVVECPPQQCGSTQYYYGIYNNGPSITYKLPLHIAVSMTDKIESGIGVNLQMGITVFQNGTETATSGSIFDNITISDPNVQSAYFYVSGNESTPVGAASLFGEYYDTEFVYGGGGNGASTSFEQMNSTLGLYYTNNSGGQLEPFQSYYSFGADTAEATGNLQVSYVGSGVARVTPGNPYYGYLVQAQTTSSSSNTAATSGSARTTPTSSNSSNSSSSIGAFVSPLILASVAVLVVAFALAAVLMLRKPKGPPQSSSFPPAKSPSQPPSFGSPPQFCGYCGSRLGLGARYCSNCGSPV
jgi:thermopsin